MLLHCSGHVHVNLRRHASGGAVDALHDLVDALVELLHVQLEFRKAARLLLHLDSALCAETVIEAIGIHVQHVTGPLTVAWIFKPVATVLSIPQRPLQVQEPFPRLACFLPVPGLTIDALRDAARDCVLAGIPDGVEGVDEGSDAGDVPLARGKDLTGDRRGQGHIGQVRSGSRGREEAAEVGIPSPIVAVVRQYESRYLFVFDGITQLNHLRAVREGSVRRTHLHTELVELPSDHVDGPVHNGLPQRDQRSRRILPGFHDAQQIRIQRAVRGAKALVHHVEEHLPLIPCNVDAEAVGNFSGKTSVEVVEHEADTAQGQRDRGQDPTNEESKDGIPESAAPRHAGARGHNAVRLAVAVLSAAEARRSHTCANCEQQCKTNDAHHDRQDRRGGVLPHLRKFVLVDEPPERISYGFLRVHDWSHGVLHRVVQVLTRGPCELLIDLRPGVVEGHTDTVVEGVNDLLETWADL
mmetsp:Transcript_68171/g.190302  ORF Transcript_68171/g.190302 Transcript_68171/m.190302 type:complete len:469 (+) Transcript_68171:471-1877(+)